MSENTTNNKAKGGDNLSLPIGIRQRNHLNIRVNDKNHWVGEQFRSVNHKFCTFEDELFGYRAALKIIAVTYRKRGILQLSGVISTWAPRSENNTSMYFAYVLARLIEKMGIQKVDDFFMPEPCMAFKDFYVSLIHYMAMVEIGAENEKFINDKKISQAFDMLFPKDKLPLK